MAEHRRRAALAEWACQLLGDFGAGSWYHLLVIGASFVAEFYKTVSQAIALIETVGKPGKGVAGHPSW
jgi:hypothetical protein